ncbi:carbohydrate-binding domain-containing protein [uncultured Fibrobacter sp.]|uniref:carbohydrate-binding domain-containing protein n=1 Tax=uncultured Fibrobacter sp. TaxID=261512 RepID=UPI0025EF5C1C|nr:carbohydrate-binding domain-containing protein [uncultured Fibrobacter sp.]
MKLTKLPAIAISAALGIVACSDDNGTIAQPENGTVGTELNSAGIDGLAGLSSGFEDFGNQSSGIDLNSSGSVVTSSNNTVASSGNVPASSNNAITSSNSVATSSNSVIASSNSGNPGGGENGDDENDNEDARTLNGTQILLKLSGTSATVENNNGCVEVADKKATITCPGAYYVTGESSDFQVVVNTPGTENEGNTGIYLYNATIKSSNSPILVANADKTVLHLVKGTTNVVEDGNGNHLFTKVNGAQDTSKAAIYARDDLNIKGAGTLTVKGKFKNGIQCSNDLKIKNGVITVEAEENAVKGKGSLQISGGTLNLTAKKGDGLESDECEEVNGECKNIIEGKGIVEIRGGSVTINASDDGIDAANFIRISDSTEASTLKVTAAGKGLVAEKYIYVDGGKIDVKSTGDDALHTHWQILLNAGEVTVNAKDDGIHADSALYMKGSTINVVTASEGIEAYRIFAEGGITSTFATNDGWNGAGGPKDPNAGGLSSFSESGGHIVVSGGYHYISSKGNMIDVFDANGSGKMTGGVLILEITGQSYESQGGMGMGMGMGWGMGGQGGNNCDAYNMAGGLIDTDTGFEITGGVMLAFGDFSTDTPGCASQTYNNSSYYGTDKAAFKPTYQGKHIFYGGDVKSVSQVNTAGMTEVKFPNGVSYMYK